MGIVIIGIIASVILGVASNWLYDILRARQILPDEPSVKRLAILATICIPLIYSIALSQIGQPFSSEQDVDLPQPTSTIEPIPTNIIQNNSITTEGGVNNSTINHFGGGDIVINEILPTSELNSPSVVMPERVQTTTLSTTISSVVPLTETISTPVRIDIFPKCVGSYCSYVRTDGWEPIIYPDEYTSEYMLPEELGKVAFISKQRFYDEFQGEGTTNLACDAYVLEIGVTSLAPNEWIRIENKPFVIIDSYEPTEELVHYFYISHESGGGTFHNYSIQLQSDLLGEEITSTSLSNLPDFYTLQPGEQEWFKITIDCLEPGRYKLKVGFRYIYQGIDAEIWETEIPEMYMPTNYYEWWGHSLLAPYDMPIKLNGIYVWNPETSSWGLESEVLIDEWVIAE